MAVTKDDVKELALTIAYDFVLVALIVCWVLAIAFVILESAFWLVILFFILGAGFFFMTVFLFKDENEKEDVEENDTVVEETEEVEEATT